MKAYVFPGQGAQFVGMGKDLYDNNPLAKEMFEMALVSWLLSQIGLLNRSFFHKYRRHAVVGLLVGAAFITPSSDPFTLSIVFLPLYGLYELSAFFVKKAPKEEDEENEEDNNEEYTPNFIVM